MVRDRALQRARIAMERHFRAGNHRASGVGDLPAQRRGLSEKNLRKQQRDGQREEKLQFCAVRAHPTVPAKTNVYRFSASEAVSLDTVSRMRAIGSLARAQGATGVLPSAKAAGDVDFGTS